MLVTRVGAVPHPAAAAGGGGGGGGGSQHGPSPASASAFSPSSLLQRLLGRGARRASVFAPLTRCTPMPLRSRLLAQQQQQSNANAGLGRSSRPRFGLAAATATAQHLDASLAAPVTALDLGYRKDLRQHYVKEDKVLGKGGNGVVQLVTERGSGQCFACKSIPKVLDPAAGLSERKRATHLDSVKREVAVMQKLKGCLNVVELHDVFEDDAYVYIIMEPCMGGELADRIKGSHYSERTVASYMRGVLRTLAVMHSHHILHRDIKPGNFMLLHEGERAPLKAIDFGLAVPFDPAALPMTDLGLEGTPWYMAPEALSSQVTPAADIWSAGVMAQQLLTGHLPFDDKRNPHTPAIGAIWKSILTDPLDFSAPYWSDISPEGKDFVQQLLQRDPSKRPSAKQCLEHPWLRGTSKERSTGKRLERSVVQRIQRFAQGGVFQRSVLQSITAELMAAQAGRDSASPSTPPSCTQGDQNLGAQLTPASASGAAPPGPPGAPRPSIGPAVVDCPNSPFLTTLYRDLALGEQGSVSTEHVATRLKEMGFKLESSELWRLMDQIDLDGSGRVDQAAIAASQVDWKELQLRTGSWRRLAEHAFSALDVGQDGFLDAGEISGALSSKVHPTELPQVVQQIMDEANSFHPSSTQPVPIPGGPPGIDLNQFIDLLRMGSLESLDQYDDRAGGGSTHHSGGSVDRLNELMQKTASQQQGEKEEAAAAAAARSSESAAAAAAAAAVGSLFRFDVPSSRTAAAAAAAGQQRRWVAGAPGPAGSGAAAGGVALVPAPGPEPRAGAGKHRVDGRHHGSSLYLNQVLQAHGAPGTRAPRQH